VILQNNEGNRSAVKAAKVLALDVSCPPPIWLEGSARQFFGFKPNERQSFGTAVGLARRILDSIK